MYFHSQKQHSYNCLVPKGRKDSSEPSTSAKAKRDSIKKEPSTPSSAKKVRKSPEKSMPDSDSEDANPADEEIDVRNYGEDINPQPDKSTKQYNERWEWHLGYDIFSLMENILYGVCGAHFIVDENFDVNYACCVIVFMHLFGLLIKAAYYLFLHPWEKQNPIHKKMNSLHQAMSCNLIFSSIAVLLVIGLLIVALVYGAPNMKIFIYCLFALVGLVFLIAIGVSYYLFCVCKQST